MSNSKVHLVSNQSIAEYLIDGEQQIKVVLELDSISQQDMIEYNDPEKPNGTYISKVFFNFKTIKIKVSDILALNENTTLSEAIRNNSIPKQIKDHMTSMEIEADSLEIELGDVESINGVKGLYNAINSEVFKNFAEQKALYTLQSWAILE